MFKKMFLTVTLVCSLSLSAINFENYRPTVELTVQYLCTAALPLINTVYNYQNSKQGINFKRFFGLGVTTAAFLCVPEVVLGMEKNKALALFCVSSVAGSLAASSRGLKDLMIENKDKKVDDGLPTIVRSGIFISGALWTTAIAAANNYLTAVKE